MSKNNSRDNNDFTHEHTQENRYSGTKFDRSSDPKAKAKLTFGRPGSSHPIFSTSSPAQVKMGGKCETENLDNFPTEITSKNVSMDSESKKIGAIKSERNYQPKIKEENYSPVSSCRNDKELEKDDTIVKLSSMSDDASPVILTPELHLNKGNSNANFDASNAVMLLPAMVNVGGNASAEESQLIRDEDKTALSQRLPYVNKDDIIPASSHQEIFQNQQVEVDELAFSICEHTDGKFSFVNASPMLTNEAKLKHGTILAPVVPDSNADNSDGIDPNQKKEESNIILILPDPVIRDQTNEVNVFIDYQNKRPISIEYSDEDVSFLTTLGSSARASRKVKRNSREESRIKAIKNRPPCSTLDAESVIPTKQTMKNSEEVCRSRLSRKDKHESDILNKKLRNLQKDKCQLDPGEYLAHI